MTKRYVPWLAAWILFAVGLGVFLSSINWWSYRELARNEKSSKAIVIETTCQDHQTFTYTFSVEGRTYKGSGTDGYGNPECKELRTGDQVTIHYLTSDPGISTPGDISERLRNETTSIALASFLVPTIGVSSVYWRLRRKNRRRTSR